MVVARPAPPRPRGDSCGSRAPGRLLGETVIELGSSCRSAELRTLLIPRIPRIVYIHVPCKVPVVLELFVDSARLLVLFS